MARGWAIARRTAAGVTSWNATRSTVWSTSAPRASSHPSTCHAMASPSRSGSVASTRAPAPARLARMRPSARAARRPAVS